MSHLFGIYELREKLMLLSALSLAGEKFCKRYKMGSAEYYRVYNLDDYTKRTKLIVSSYLIEISVKLRNLVDSLKVIDSKFGIEKNIKAYYTNSGLTDSVKDKDFRFICNKIIHAELFNLDFVGNVNYHKDMVWWSGQITVSGTYQKERWEFFFLVLDWCDAIVEFLNDSEKQVNMLQSSSHDIQIYS